MTNITSRPVTLSDLTDNEVRSFCGLLALRRPVGNEVRVRLDQVDSALRTAGFEPGLIAVLEALSGPIQDRRAERQLAASARATLWSAADGHDAARSDEVRTWLESLRRRGRMTRLDVEEPTIVLLDALTVVGWLLDRRDQGHPDLLPLSRSLTWAFTRSLVAGTV